MKNVWIVDDDRSIRWVLEKALQKADIPCKTFSEAESVLQAIKKEQPALILSDIHMPGKSGLEMLAEIKKSYPKLPIIIMTAYSDLDSAVASFQGGAFEYLPKPFDIDKAIELVRRATEESEEEEQTPAEETASEIIGKAPAMQEVFRAIGRLSQSKATVLLTGESGAVKEVVARAVHKHSPRSNAPFVAINMAAIPKDLMETELFGHEKGAFTGAVSDRKGYFEVTDGGTIFLDEVGELPLPTQARLLRVLETGEFIRVGSSKVQKTNVRVIAATNLDIPQAVKNWKFREDLYYRLNTIPITIPPLRERKEDIPLLFRKFAADFAEKYRMPAIRLTEDAVKVLQDFRWPGNIRQLKNVTEQISVIEQERIADGATLRKYIPENDPMLPTLTGGHDKGDASFASEREILYKILFDMKKDMNDLKRLVYDLMQNEPQQETVVTEPTTSLVLRNLYNQEPGQFSPAPSPTMINHREDRIQDTEAVIEESFSIEEKERELILKALEKNHGKRKLAAKDLGISERTLYRKLKEYNLEN